MRDEPAHLTSLSQEHVLSHDASALDSSLPPQDSCADRTDDAGARQGEPAPMGIGPQLPTPATRSVIKGPMRTIIMIRIDRFPQIVQAVCVLGLTDLLRRIARLAEIPIAKPGRQLITLDYDDC